MKRKIVLVLLPFLLHVLSTIVSGGNYFYNTFIFILVSFSFGPLLKSKKELLITITGYIVLSTIITFINGGDIIRFVVMIILFYIVAIISGYLSKRKKYIFILFPLLFTLFMLFGFKNYKSLVFGRNHIVQKQLPNILLFNKNLNSVKFNQKDKVYVLDFWSTSCGICIKKFPEFEKTVEKYKDNSNVLFYSVNIPVRKENINDNIKSTYQKYNYNFNKLFAKDFSPCDSLGFNKFPTLLLIKNDSIYYQGSFITGKDITVHHIDTEIERVLNIK